MTRPRIITHVASMLSEQIIMSGPDGKWKYKYEPGEALNIAYALYQWGCLAADAPDHRPAPRPLPPDGYSFDHGCPAAGSGGVPT